MGEDREKGARGLTALPPTRRALLSSKQRFRLWAPVAAMMGVQFLLSSRSHVPPVLPVFPGADKLLHGAWFFLLGLLAYRAAREGEGWTRRGAIAAVLFGALAWGASDELHQHFVPGREVEAADLAADVAGSFLAVLVPEGLLRRIGLSGAPR